MHRYFLEGDSSKFKDVLSTPASPGERRAGTSDVNPVMLDMTVSDLELIFWVIYNK
jgi:hypothetical protein